MRLRTLFLLLATTAILAGIAFYVFPKVLPVSLRAQASETTNEQVVAPERLTEGSTEPLGRSDITVQELAVELQTEADPFILDVRQDWEYARGHVPTAVLLPVGELESRLSELPTEQTIYVICQSGARSSRATDILIQAGFTDVRNILGGTGAWLNAGYAVER